MQVSFDIDEFLAYLLTGCFMLVSLSQLFPQMFNGFIDLTTLGNGPHVAFARVVAIGALVLVLGHFSSVVTRFVSRPFLRKLFGNPRTAVFTRENDKFWNESLKNKIEKKFKKKFGYSISDENLGPAPRLVRAYVINSYPATREIRDRIVRARSLCGNSVLPMTLLSLSSAMDSHWIVSISLLVLSLALLWKQQDLDVREWKEIYTAFVLAANNKKG